MVNIVPTPKSKRTYSTPKCLLILGVPVDDILRFRHLQRVMVSVVVALEHLLVVYWKLNLPIFVPF